MPTTPHNPDDTERVAVSLCKQALEDFAANRITGEELSRTVVSQTRDLAQGLSSAAALVDARNDAITALKHAASLRDPRTVQTAQGKISTWEYEANALSTGNAPTR